MKDAVVRARIEVKLKDEASAVLGAMGLDVSDAIRLFLRQVVRERRLPFVVRAPAVLSAKHLWAMKRQSQIRDRQSVARGSLPPEGVLLIRPADLAGVKVEWPQVPLCDD